MLRSILLSWRRRVRTFRLLLRRRASSFRQQQPTSSRRFSRMLTPASRLRLSRLDCRSRTTTCRACSSA
ncbi:Uncharacterised protein [Segatella copri]|nr:Uncharacterised protein [Segatella copri]